MAIWQMVLAGLALWIVFRQVWKAVSRWRFAKEEQRRILRRVHELREMGYDDSEFYIDTKYGIPVVRLYEDG